VFESTRIFLSPAVIYINREHAETSMKGTGRKEKRNRETVRLDVPDVRILLPKGSWYWTIRFLTGCGKPLVSIALKCAVRAARATVWHSRPASRYRENKNML